MVRTIAIANQKGGVGKTTTAVNLTASLASMGRRVLLVDLDPQGNATMGCGVDKNDLAHSACDLMLGNRTFRECLARVEEPAPGFDLVPANGDLTAAEVGLMNLPQRERRLARLLSEVGENYELVLIDCPPSLNMLTINALMAAYSVLIPIQCEYYALEGLSALLHTIDRIRSGRNGAPAIEGILRTMHDPRNNLANQVSTQLVTHFNDQVYRTIIPRNVRLAEAPSHGQPVLLYDRGSRGAASYLALAGEVLHRQEKRRPTTREHGHGAV
ncbi:MAG: ParA family protein [Candidatus Thiosymbion ectosymbiont of Robbea hypermnestra]|nr:ParA family protein [Candidatus Thiosymbion ectosymbiont of Robbea hypermnestra]